MNIPITLKVVADNIFILAAGVALGYVLGLLHILLVIKIGGKNANNHNP